MAEIIIIVAASKNGVIGRGNQMPWHLPRDLAYFKAKTSGFPVIMGRNTFLSIGRTLPQRRNIVLSRRENLAIDGAEVLPNLEQALTATAAAEKVFIIGGGQIYAQALPLADTVLLTKVNTEITDGEVFFPPLDAQEWQLLNEEFFPPDEKNALEMSFCHYQRR